MRLNENAREESWRLLPFHVGSSSLHFALSDALVRHTVEPTIWWHEATRPTLILGNGQHHSTSHAEQLADVEIVQRQSGGTAVYATSGVFGLDVALPVSHPLALTDIVEAYRWLGEVWVDATRSLGVDSRIVSLAEARDRARHSSEHSRLRLACFGTLSPYEVAVGSRKLVGLAQVRRRSAVLLQSATHLQFDAITLARLIEPTGADTLAAELHVAAVGLHEAAPARPTVDEVMDAFRTSLRAGVGVSLRAGDWSEAEVQHVRKHRADSLPAGDPA